MLRHPNICFVEEERRGACISSSSRGSGACMSASWLCERRHNYCVYKAELLLLLNYWGGGALKEEEQREGVGE